MFPRLPARATFVADTNFVSAVNVSQFAQPKKHHEQQRIRNNVSSFASTLTALIAYRAKLLNAGWLIITRARALLVIKRAWLINWCWLPEHACIKLVSTSNGFWKGTSETQRFGVWSKRGYFILTWKKIDMRQSAVYWWESKSGFFHLKMRDLFAARKKFRWGRLVSYEA